MEIYEEILVALLGAVFSVASHAAIVNDNCASDQSAALQAAIDAQKTNVVLPAGCIGISKPIYAKSWVSLFGAGKRLTKIKALSGFKGVAINGVTIKSLVILGTNQSADSANNRQMVFDAMVSDLTLDASLAGSGTNCVYVAGAQEGSGIQRTQCVGVQGTTTDAIRILGNVNRAVFNEIEIYPAAPIRYGISNENAYCGCEMSNITVGVQSTAVAGLHFLNGQFTANRIHCEFASNCIEIIGDNGLGVVTSVDGPTASSTTGNLLFVSGASKIVAQGLAKNGYTNTVLSYWGAGINRADPGIGQILINN